MAITENSFTAEEFTGALQANPALVDLVSGFIVADANKEHPLRKKIEDPLVSPVTSRHATELEKIVKEYTGEDKSDANEKYYDYAKRAFGKVKGTLAALTAERDTLKAKSTESLTQAERDRLALLETAVANKDKDWGEKLTAKEKEIADLKVATTTEKAFSKIRTKYKADIPPMFIQLAEEKAMQEISKIAKVQENGAVTFLDAQGKVILNQSTFQPATAEEIAEPFLKDLIDTGKKTEGAGSKEDTAGKDTGTKGKFTAVPASVKTRVQLTEHLFALGYLDTDEDFTKIMEEHGKKLPLR